MTYYAEPRPMWHRCTMKYTEKTRRMPSASLRLVQCRPPTRTSKVVPAKPISGPAASMQIPSFSMPQILRERTRYGTLDDGLHLTVGSPSMNTGSNAAVPATLATDITGRLESRRARGHGCYEGVGGSSSLVFVSTTGDCGVNLPCFSSIQAAIDAPATASGSVIRIAEVPIRIDFLNQSRHSPSRAGGIPLLQHKTATPSCAQPQLHCRDRLRCRC